MFEWAQYVCSLVFNKLPSLYSTPLTPLERKRRLPENDEIIPPKIMRLAPAFDDDFNFVRGRPNCAMHRRSMQSKENHSEEEDECAIIAEIPKSKSHNSGYGRKHERSHTCNLPPTRFSQQMAKTQGDSRSELLSQRWNEFKKNLMSKNVVDDDEDLEVVKHIKHGSYNKKGSMKDTGVKKIFTTKRLDNLSTSKAIKSRRGFEANLKEKLRKQNFQETYRLKERWQYEQLLKSQVGGKRLSLPYNNKGQSVSSPKSTVPFIDITEEKNNVAINRSRESIPRTSSTRKDSEDDLQILHEVPKVRSLQDVLNFNPGSSEALEESWACHIKSLLSGRELLRLDEDGPKIDESKSLEVLCTKTNEESFYDDLEEKLRKHMRITGPDEEEARCCIVKLSDKQLKKIQSALAAHPAEQVLAHQFGVQVTRRDMQTLKGLNWLNDEVINFYMQLIMERSKKNPNLPKVYAFNTFFYPKLVTNGHSSLKRWTKKIDIFSYDIILVPVHLGMHWCMSVIDFRSKEVRYYDSMGAPNDRCLQALLYYLEAESADKKNKKYDTSCWEQINVDDIPQQMNGSDCGVFSCMFAEHIARDSPIDFSQDNMPFLRKKMVLEILEMQLLT